MKTITIISVIIASATGLFAEDHGARVMNDLNEFYRERIDRTILDFLNRGAFPRAEDIVRIQSDEYHFLSAIQLQPELRRQMPTLLLSKSSSKDPRHLPGQFIVQRAMGAGLDLTRDNLQGRDFRRMP